MAYIGLSFAIRIDLVMKVKDVLLKYGKMRRSRLDVRVQDVDERLEESGLPLHCWSFGA